MLEVRKLQKQAGEKNQLSASLPKHLYCYVTEGNLKGTLRIIFLRVRK